MYISLKLTKNVGSILASMQSSFDHTPLPSFTSGLAIVSRIEVKHT